MKSVGPAFANFGFYPLWLGAVESSPSTFYRHDVRRDDNGDSIDELRDQVEPTVFSLKLDAQYSPYNVRYDALYVLAGIAIPIVVHAIEGVVTCAV